MKDKHVTETKHTYICTILLHIHVMKCGFFRGINVNGLLKITVLRIRKSLQ